MTFYDYETEARKAGLAQSQIDRLCQAVRKEFPDDEMMFELHVLRACMAIREGRLTMEAALREEEQTAA